jgi:hypothetical protein
MDSFLAVPAFPFVTFALLLLEDDDLFAPLVLEDLGRYAGLGKEG